MTNRTTHSVEHSSARFNLSGFDKPLPAGDYRIDCEEEAIEGLSWIAWHRVGAFIHLPAVGVKSAVHHMVPISADELNEIFKKDNKT